MEYPVLRRLADHQENRVTLSVSNQECGDMVLTRTRCQTSNMPQFPAANMDLLTLASIFYQILEKKSLQECRIFLGILK